MRLAEFIHTNRDRIIENWVEFARSLLPWAKDMSERGLRDHAEEILTAVVTDMQTPQSDYEQAEKSKGYAEYGDLSRIGNLHAIDRLETGLTLEQLVSEYRALRASVLRLWEEAQGENEKEEEMTRFNEAIDEILAESATRYTKAVEITRERFLGI